MKSGSGNDICNHPGDSAQPWFALQDAISRVAPSWLLILTGMLVTIATNFTNAQSQFEADHPGLFHRRGVDYFFAGKFEAAIREFDKAIELDPRLEPRHWQRGIAYYYAKEYQKGVDQFELHQTVNSQDVENAVWHFICKAKLEGVEAARASLIPIRQDGRIPMEEIWNLFAGKGTVEDVLKAAERQGPYHVQYKNYAHLYLGLYYEAMGEPESAKKHIHLAAYEYPRNNYMGRVAKVHAKVLE